MYKIKAANPLGYVLQEFPFPLALTYARLQEEMDRQEPIAAAWQLRDAFECLVKFSACLAVADFLQARPNAAEAGEVVGLLFKSSGLSLGDWHTLLELALKPLKALPPGDRLAATSRCLPELFAVFFKPNGKRTPLNRMIDGDSASFVNWRNRVFGHGVFQQDRRWYAGQTLAWLAHLHEFYEALRPVLAGRTLVSRAPNGTETIWQGSQDLSPALRHQHEPLSEPVPLVLTPARGRAGGLRLGPLLSLQRCAICLQPALFFFDRNRYQQDRDRHRTAFLEYFRGHTRELKDWQATRRLAALLPADFEWRREAYDKEEIQEGIRLAFRTFETEYLRPAYLLDAIWRVVEDEPRGYLHLEGPGGVGKTYAVQGLEREAAHHGAVVLAHFLQSGAATHYQTFISELKRRAYEQLRFTTSEVQAKGATTPEALQADFTEFVAKLMEANSLDTLIVALDALDELPDPGPNTPVIPDLLPPPAALPMGCFVLLTSRAALHPRIRAAMERLRAQGGTLFTAFSIHTEDAANQALLRVYLQSRLPVALRTPAQGERVLQRSGGIFLYAYHLCRALEAGAFTDVDELPEGNRFYADYLARLRARVGATPYNTVYLPVLLLLCAAWQPVTLQQLRCWGVPGERLAFALLDLQDFLRVHRQPSWDESLIEAHGENRYELVHEEFLRFVRNDTELCPPAGARLTQP